jgi:hypothetical protein
VLVADGLRASIQPLWPQVVSQVKVEWRAFSGVANTDLGQSFAVGAECHLANFIVHWARPLQFVCHLQSTRPVVRRNQISAGSRAEMFAKHRKTTCRGSCPGRLKSRPAGCSG